MDIITRGTKFYEGKNNTLYWTNNPYIIEMEAKNETSNLISTLLFKLHFQIMVFQFILYVLEQIPFRKE